MTLHLVQTAADGSGIVVRVFHGRLHKRVDALNTSFFGKKYYKVIEYQRRASADFPAEVDLGISCELSEMGPLRDSVVKRMTHVCKQSCHPHDPHQDCIQGCPW